MGTRAGLRIVTRATIPRYVRCGTTSLVVVLESAALNTSYAVECRYKHDIAL